MNKTLQLTDDSWSYGSYVRKSFKRDVVYTVLAYKEIRSLYNLNLGKLIFYDGLAEQMLTDQLITPEQMERYKAAAAEALQPLSRFDEAYIEDIYGTLHKERKSCFGAETIAEEQCLMAKRQIVFDTAGGIDQSRKKESLLASCDSVIFVLTNPQFYFLMEKDMAQAAAQGKCLYVVVSDKKGEMVPDREFMERVYTAEYGVHYLAMSCKNGGLNLQGITWDEKLQKQIDNQQACMFVYGEDGLLSCKDMRIDSIVHAIPSGFFTKTVTNQHGMTRACVVCIPKEFDITKWVGIFSKTRISYWQLCRLWEAYGDVIYEQTPEELYHLYPQYFLNIYAAGIACAEASPDYPIQIKWQEDIPHRLILQQFDKRRDDAVKAYLNGYDNIKYLSAYFDERLEQTDIPWFSQEQQKGILVHAIRVGKVKNSYVVNCKGRTVRRVFEEQRSEEGALSLVSNFLFFLTPRLAQLYNELRKDEPSQQIPFKDGHIDYKLYYKDGRRVETFPLFKKTCIGMMKNGRYLFFHYELAGGSVTINGKRLCWEKRSVNADNPAKIAVYTPFYAKEAQETDIRTYRMSVGEGRVNIVVVQEEIICIRRGPVFLSSIGVVISLEENAGMEFLDKLGARPLKCGYYACENYEMDVVLDNPKDIAKKDWEQIVWAYGGGLSLILDGKGLCDDGEEAMLQWLSKEGWMSVMSRQTQESAIHELMRHPRTGIGMTKDGDLVILVYAGRTMLSVGADYREMTVIARRLFPDILKLMNVDGGGSSILGMAVNNSFMELSYPATSTDNCAGMVRTIHTMLCIEP